MQELFLTLGLEGWKPLVSTLVLPPVPFLVLVLAGARLMFSRRLLGWLLLLTGVAGLWFSATPAAAHAMLHGVLRPPPALAPADIAELKRAPRTAIVVLGGGRQRLAPEYGTASLKPRGIERLRYGLWLARETGLPVAFSGGIGHGDEPGPTEAELAAGIAARDFGRPLRWLETRSRDTHENARYTVALLREQGIERIVLVTHADHMPRSLRNFQRAAQDTGVQVLPAPMGAPPDGRYRAYDFMPSARGFELTWVCLHEWVGLLAGA
jgi:uncharacterized SAM-binding protein YcdF (DUF218 family)